MGMGAASKQTDQRPGVWGLEIMEIMFMLPAGSEPKQFLKRRRDTSPQFSISGQTSVWLCYKVNVRHVSSSFLSVMAQVLLVYTGIARCVVAH